MNNLSFHSLFVFSLALLTFVCNNVCAQRVMRMGAANVPMYTATAVGFDGTQSISNNLPNQVPGTQGTLSVWFYPTSDGVDMKLLSFTASERCSIARDNTGKFSIYLATAAGVTLISKSVGTFNTAHGWNHVTASWDTSEQLFHMYTNGVSAGASTWSSSGIIGYGTSTKIVLGARAGTGGNIYAGYMSDFYFAPVYMDLSVKATRDLFYNSSTRRAGGSLLTVKTVTGIDPWIVFQGAVAQWGKSNYGTLTGTWLVRSGANVNSVLTSATPP